MSIFLDCGFHFESGSYPRSDRIPNIPEVYYVYLRVSYVFLILQTYFKFWDQIFGYNFEFWVKFQTKIEIYFQHTDKILGIVDSMSQISGKLLVLFEYLNFVLVFFVFQNYFWVFKYYESFWGPKYLNQS